jgi:hypothetical protein
VGLDRADVQCALETILTHVSDTEFRLVGTASCVLRGIEIAANDIDVLFRERTAIDTWTASMADVAELLDEPTWLDDSSQYFARLDVAGVTVELSTVEIDARTDTAECVGAGPWVHFDRVSCGEFSVPAVALELRLVTELTRHRLDHVGPIVAYLRDHPCDIALVERGLADLSTPPDDIAQLVNDLVISWPPIGNTE